ncbi:MAG: toprim domain-containing protein [Promethearchaeota archaeon]
MSSTRNSLSKQELLEESFRNGVTLLIELSAEGVIVVVEGQKDALSLRRLGLTGPIVTLAGHSIITLAESFAGASRVLILFDFDTRGEQLTELLTLQLQGTGTRIQYIIRKKLKRAFSWQSRVIEGLKPLDAGSSTTKF